MKPTILYVGALLLFAGRLGAQNPEVERTQADLGRTQRQLQQNRSEVDRLLDLRLRHDLGLPADEADRTFRPPAPVGTEAMQRMSEDLRDEDAATANLLEQYNKLRTQVEQLKAEAEARMQKAGEERPFVTVPTAGSVAAGPVRAPGDTTTVAAPPAAEPEAVGTAPSVVPTPVPASAPLGPLRAQITGSTDHQLVAQALFKAGQQHMDDAQRATELGQPVVARQFADRGKESLKRALDELAPLLQGKEPPYAALFYQGRCLELLFRYGERYENLNLRTSARDYQVREQQVVDPFLKITVRDVRKTGERGDVDVLGPWGLAAQTAQLHFRWMNQHADYDAIPTIRALTWPGEKSQ